MKEGRKRIMWQPCETQDRVGDLYDLLIAVHLGEFLGRALSGRKGQRRGYLETV